MSISRNTPKRNRRGTLVVSAAFLATSALILSGCSQAESPAEGGDTDATSESAELRFSWWGADARHANMQTIIDNFAAENAGVTINPDFTDWGGYWDKLATVTAGGDTPDIFMQEDRYLGEYADRNVLADLSKLDISTDKLDQSLLSSGKIGDALYGIPTGSNVLSVIANTKIFADAGVALPDDKTWTWADYVDIANEISEGTEGDVFGVQDATFNEAGFMVYLRQHGQELYAEDGALGYEDDLLAEWFQQSLDLLQSGGQAPAEYLGLPTGQDPISTNKAAMSITWSAQLGVHSVNSGNEMVLLRMPGESEFDRTGMYFKPGMYLSISAKSEYPEAAAKFVDYFANSPDVGKIVLSDLGLPSNTDVIAAISQDLSPAEQSAAKFVADLQQDIVDAPPTMPVGAGEVASIIMRMNEEVLFERLTPVQAASQFRAEVETAIG